MLPLDSSELLHTRTHMRAQFSLPCALCLVFIAISEEEKKTILALPATYFARQQLAVCCPTELHTPADLLT